jgi:signal transduction histidine kinase
MTDLRKLVEECAQAIEPLAKQNQISIEIETPERLSPIKIDPDRIKQVVTNLLSNAVKFTPEGGHITVRLWEDNRALRCDVIDTGPGIPSDELEVIFDKFYQIKQGKGEKTEGTGLGLTISRGMISVHGGRIWASSTLGEGATFSFSLPKQYSEQLESGDS